MKKLFALILALVMILPLCACASVENADESKYVGVYEADRSRIMSSDLPGKIIDTNDYAYSKATLTLNADGTGTLKEVVVQEANYDPYGYRRIDEETWRLGETVSEGTLTWVAEGETLIVSLSYDDYDDLLSKKATPTHKENTIAYKMVANNLINTSSNQVAYTKVS